MKRAKEDTGKKEPAVSNQCGLEQEHYEHGRAAGQAKAKRAKAKTVFEEECSRVEQVLKEVLALHKERARVERAQEKLEAKTEQAMEEARVLKEVRPLKEMRAKALEMRAQEEQALEEARAKALEKKVESARKLKAMGIELEQIAEISGLDPETLAYL
ncbi:MAG: hypothetical protein LBC51_00640 [Treponema sp.]|jgi:hypothetical protein|nr:hypothetical protein [Treponema sp.]